MASMDAKSAAADFAELFPAVYRRFYRRLPPDLHRLTSESMAALHHLEIAGPLTVSEAARHLDRSQSAMTEMIDRLERRQLVARISDERDRRRTLVWLTDEGRTALDKAHQVLSETRLEQAFAVLEENDRANLLDAMRLLVETSPHVGPSDEKGPEKP